MKKILIILFSLSMCMGLHSQEIVQTEYFFDSDPGYGNATQIPFVPDVSIEITVDLPISGLTDGFHTLYIRTRDTSDNWSFIQKRSFLKDLVQVNENTSITAIEYFFDEDPGYGNGTSMNVSVGATVNVIENISLTALINGFHTLYIRALDEFGNWSFIQKRSFLKDIVEVHENTVITAAEYFFDDDPGYGNGTAMSFTSGPTIEILEDLPLAELADGFHTFYIRALDEFGNWSFIQKRTFIKDQYVRGGPVPITELEYFIDADPGQGNGIDLPGADDIDIIRDTTFSLNDLSCGIHSLYTRAKNEAGIWSFPQRRSFLFDDNRVEVAQFRFDSIPVYSDWTVSNPFAPDFEILADIDFEGICDLDPGWYHIDARVRREKSWWSDENTDSIEIKNFYDQTGLLKDQFDNPLPMAQIEVQNVGSYSTTESGQYSFAVPKCWGDTIEIQKDSAYSALKSYVFENPVLDYSAHHILGDIDSNLIGYKCINVSGSINTDLAYVCENTTLIANKVGEVVDTGSISGYILHDGENTLGMVHDMRLSASFANDGSLPQNQKLFISPVVGRPGQTDLFDVDHECTDIMLPGKPVIFLNVKDSVFLVLDSVGMTISVDADTMLATPCSDCEIDTMFLSQSDFTCTDHGLNTEQLTVMDSSGNSSSCQIVVRVDDLISPKITCRSDTMVFTDPGLCGFTSTDNRLEPTSTWDNCPVFLQNDFDNTGSLNGDLIPPGVHLIKWTIDDTHGNSSQCSFTITIVDNELPGIICPPDITIEIGPGKCDTLYQYPVTSNDNCAGEIVTLESGIGSGGPFAIGDFVEQYKVTDASGNEALCTFNIRVVQLINEIQDTICFEDSIYLEDTWQFLPGIFVDTFQNMNGCDSIVITTVDTTTTCYWPTEIVYVDSAATGANNGFDWENAFVDLQFALKTPQRFLNIEQIWTAKGTYFPTPGVNRLISFVLTDSLDVLGGFDGTEVDSTDRNFVLNKTVLSGDIGVIDDSLDNSYHVLVSPDSVSGVQLDGFTIRDGAAIGASPEDQTGGGIVNFGKMTLANAFVLDNTSLNPGAQILNKGSSALLTLRNTVIVGSTAVPVLNSNQAILRVVQTNSVGNGNE